MKRLLKIGLILALGVTSISLPMNQKITYALYNNPYSDSLSSYNQPIFQNNYFTPNINQHFYNTNTHKNFSFGTTPTSFNKQNLVNPTQSYSFLNQGINNFYHFPSTLPLSNPLTRGASFNSYAPWTNYSQNFSTPNLLFSISPVNSYPYSNTPYALNASTFTS